mmetsp:Transcript_40014/g.89727  ORF Transcript_40014/g.89727 Transcript_40014/m.89727 type:complete len:284 (-) Transcript_40014:107-958(-)
MAPPKRRQEETEIPRLVILDMNGLLIKRNQNNKKAAQMRPHLDEFLERLWSLEQRGAKFAVWSSMMERNLWPLVEEVFGERSSDLAFVWDQSWCTESWRRDMVKPLLSKELIKLAETEWGEYLPDRVLLIDDDEIKCRSNEECTAIHPTTFEGFEEGWESDDLELLYLASYLENLCASGRSVQEFVCNTPYGSSLDDAGIEPPAKRRATYRSEDPAANARRRTIEAYWPSTDEWLPATVVQELKSGSLRIHWEEDGSESVIPYDYAREVAKQPPAKPWSRGRW